MANTATALYFDGTDNNYLTVNDTTIGDFGDDVHPGPFCMELWVNHSAFNSRNAFLSRRTNAQSDTNSGGWGFNSRSDGAIQIIYNIWNFSYIISRYNMTNFFSY